ncbi:hypothetical protein DP56_5927 [Burkholderia pseudomallei]|nr:hypothetical protein DP56_5927 [Burkholderia pseudomallei]
MRGVHAAGTTKTHGRTDEPESRRLARHRFRSADHRRIDAAHACPDVFRALRARRRHARRACAGAEHGAVRGSARTGADGPRLYARRRARRRPRDVRSRRAAHRALAVVRRAAAGRGRVHADPAAARLSAERHLCARAPENDGPLVRASRRAGPDRAVLRERASSGALQRRVPGGRDERARHVGRPADAAGRRDARGARARRVAAACRRVRAPARARALLRPPARDAVACRLRHAARRIGGDGVDRDRRQCVQPRDRPGARCRCARRRAARARPADQAGRRGVALGPRAADRVPRGSGRAHVRRRGGRARRTRGAGLVLRIHHARRGGRRADRPPRARPELRRGQCDRHLQDDGRGLIRSVPDSPVARLPSHRSRHDARRRRRLSVRRAVRRSAGLADPRAVQARRQAGDDLVRGRLSVRRAVRPRGHRGGVRRRGPRRSGGLPAIWRHRRPARPARRARRLDDARARRRVRRFAGARHDGLAARLRSARARADRAGRRRARRGARVSGRAAGAAARGREARAGAHRCRRRRPRRARRAACRVARGRAPSEAAVYGADVRESDRRDAVAGAPRAARGGRGRRAARARRGRSVRGPAFRRRAREARARARRRVGLDRLSRQPVENRRAGPADRLGGRARRGSAPDDRGEADERFVHRADRAGSDPPLPGERPACRAFAHDRADLRQPLPRARERARAIRAGRCRMARAVGRHVRVGAPRRRPRRVRGAQARARAQRDVRAGRGVLRARRGCGQPAAVVRRAGRSGDFRGRAPAARGARGVPPAHVTHVRRERRAPGTRARR